MKFHFMPILLSQCLVRIQRCRVLESGCAEFVLRAPLNVHLNQSATLSVSASCCLHSE